MESIFAVLFSYMSSRIVEFLSSAVEHIYYHEVEVFLVPD